MGGIVLALDANGNVTHRYLNGPNTSANDQFFSTLAEENDTTTPAVVTWDLLDAEGSLRDVASSTGAVLDHLNYNSFGQDIYESNPTVSHIDGYGGGVYDPSTGLVYDVHRWYDPLATVWISADPMGFAAGDADLTRYVGNDSANETDPSGEYGRAGHFWTTFIVARAAGYSATQAYSLAYYSQLPDQVVRFDAVKQWLHAWNPFADRIWKINTFVLLHSLHGGNATDVVDRRELLKNMISGACGKLKTWEIGFLIHALGDAFAHTYIDVNGNLRAFGYPDGHPTHAPDIIANYPEKYREYVRTLFDALSKANGGRPTDQKLLEKLLDLAANLPPGEEDAITMMAVLAREAGYTNRYAPTDDHNIDGAMTTPTENQLQAWFGKVRKAQQCAASQSAGQ